MNISICKFFPNYGIYLYIIIAGVDFTPGRYNATFTPGATTANTSIPVIAGNYSEVIKQFSLRLFVDGATYE